MAWAARSAGSGQPAAVSTSVGSALVSSHRCRNLGPTDRSDGGCSPRFGSAEPSQWAGMSGNRTLVPITGSVPGNAAPMREP
jgi:hypothetical protein